VKPNTDSLTTFLTRHRLPPAFRYLIDEHYAPLASWLLERSEARRPLVVGINGAQGTGKSTLARYLQLDLAQRGCNAVVLSLDDFYLTRAERQALAAQQHPLLATRGVPGTHDVPLLQRSLAALQTLTDGSSCTLPRFDKSCDDRAAPETWTQVDGPIDIVLFEGWCVGTGPQSAVELEPPINELERREDADGIWRRFVNDRLRGEYAALFAHIDVLVYLQAPDFESVYRWRLEQENKLADAIGTAAGAIMNAQQIARFIEHYERLTRVSLATLPETADAVFTLDANHHCVEHRMQRP